MQIVTGFNILNTVSCTIKLLIGLSTTHKGTYFNECKNAIYSIMHYHYDINSELSTT